MEESIIHDRVPVMASFYSNPRENDAINTETQSIFIDISQFPRIHIARYSIFLNSFFIITSSSRTRIFISVILPGVNDT